jgi:predicted MFS family arabinose efflux permease
MNKEIRILLYSSNLWYFGEGMLGPLFAVFAKRVGGDILYISWAWGLYLIIAGVLTIFFGKISDKKKISKKTLLICGYSLNTIFTFGYLLVSSTLHLFLVQAGLGVAAALATPTWDALYAKYEDKQKRGYLWGMAGGQGQIFTGVSLVLGGLIVNQFSFQFLFIVMGTIQLIATIYQAQILQK